VTHDWVSSRTISREERTVCGREDGEGGHRVAWWRFGCSRRKRLGKGRNTPPSASSHGKECAFQALVALRNELGTKSSATVFDRILLDANEAFEHVQLTVAVRDTPYGVPDLGRRHL